MGVLSVFLTIFSAVCGLGMITISIIMVIQIQDFWKFWVKIVRQFNTQPNVEIPDDLYTHVPEWRAAISAASLGLIGGFIQFMVGAGSAGAALCADKRLQKVPLVLSHAFFVVVFVAAFAVGLHYEIGWGGKLQVVIPGTSFTTAASANPTEVLYKAGDAFLSVLAADSIICFAMVVLFAVCV